MSFDLLASVPFSRNEIIFIVGPTAVGKSAVAVDLAERLNGEVISCDAMQVYREPVIVSGKPSSFLCARVPHHLLGVVSVQEAFSAVHYRALALKALQDVLGRGRCPIFCGGSGMYVMALLDGIFEGAATNAPVRERLAQEIKKVGLEEMHQRLSCVDPKAAAKINSHDAVRILRALEVFEITGEPISQRQPQRDGLWGKYDIRVVCLTSERAALYSRAEKRIDTMFEQGLVDEVRQLRALQLTPSARCLIGLPEVGGFLCGEYDEARARYLMKLNTRHYIKRQLTWFRKDKRVEWLII